MSTLLLRLAGPMQAWGTQSRFTERDTGLEPSKSGVVGLLCAALGRPRTAPIDDLAALKMGVRVDSPGSMRVDYQTAGGVHRLGERYGVAMIDGKEPRTVQSRRYYLADADFLVGLEGDDGLLRTVDGALGSPVWALYLGRKSFVPGVPVRLPDIPPFGPGLRPERLEAALRSYLWPGGPEVGAEAAEHSVTTDRRPARLRLVLETEPDEGAEVRRDAPISFAERRHGLRYVRSEWIERPEEQR